MSATLQDQPTPSPVLAYDGSIGDLYRIFLVNLLPMIVTGPLGAAPATGVLDPRW